MVRSLTAGMVTEVTAVNMTPVLLIKLAFPSADINLWTGISNITFNSDVYQGVGDFGGISSIEESILLSSATMTFSLSGISATNIALVLSEDYQERLVKLYLGMLDSSENLVATPYLILTGRMDVMEIEEGPEEALIRLTVVNRLVDLERPKERLYTAEDQKEHFGGDLGLDFVPSLSDGKEVVWGRG